MTPPILGIDLGTTTSLVAVFRDGAPVILPNALGEPSTPSAVSVDADGTILVGAPALARATTAPDRTVRFFKREMGRDRTWTLGPHTFTPQELSALVLRSVRQDAEAALGMPVEEAIVTVPAYFDEAQRQATRDAGRLAGLRVERILNEPTAAALAYGLQNRERDARVVVLDLGGGTFDVTVLELIDGILEIQATAGDTHLGGEDFTDALARAVLPHAGLPAELPPAAWARLREATDGVRKRLGAGPARLFVPALDLDGRLVDVDLELAPEQLELAVRPLLDRLRAPILLALGDARLAAAAVDDVLLVGGATRMPLVAKLATQLFGKLPRRELPPDEAVALGAAVQAAVKQSVPEVEDVVVTDVCPHTLGTAATQGMGASYVDDVFVPIIERATTIPCSRVQRFWTCHPAQTQVVVGVFQGERPIASQNRSLGEVKVDGFQPSTKPLPVDIRFTYDLNGLLEVEAVVGGKTVRTHIEDVPGRMSPEALARAIARLARLKIHPRELLPNRTALERATAAYQERTGHDRERLGSILHAFRGALDAQDTPRIDALRTVLEGELRA